MGAEISTYKIVPCRTAQEKPKPWLYYSFRVKNRVKNSEKRKNILLLTALLRTVIIHHVPLKIGTRKPYMAA